MPHSHTSTGNRVRETRAETVLLSPSPTGQTRPKRLTVPVVILDKIRVHSTGKYDIDPK